MSSSSSSAPPPPPSSGGANPPAASAAAAAAAQPPEPNNDHPHPPSPPTAARVSMASSDAEQLQTAQVLNVEMQDEPRSIAALDYKVAVGGGGGASEIEGGGGGSGAGGASHISEDPPASVRGGGETTAAALSSQQASGGSLPPPQQPQYHPHQQQEPPAAAPRQPPQQPSAYYSGSVDQKQQQYYHPSSSPSSPPSPPPPQPAPSDPEGGGGGGAKAPPPPPVPAPVSSSNNTRSKLVLVAGGLAVLVVLVAAVVGGVCGSGNCGGGSSSSEKNLIEGPPVTTTVAPVAPPAAGAAATDPPVAVDDGTATAAPAVPVTTTTTDAPTPAAAQTQLGRIAAAGQLSCGVMDVAGQSEPASDGQRSGFSVDLCRAVAAAIFGTSEGTLTVTPVDATNRFQLLNDGTVDLLAASVSHTMERDLYEPTTQVGYSFTIPYLYGGMVFAGIPDYAECADTLNVNGTCADVRVCVVDGSTYVDRVTELLPDASLTVTPTMNALYERLRDGICNVLAGDQFEVSQSAVEQIGYFGDYAVGTTLFSKEPLALVTREEDPTWSDFVNWVIQGLLAAEEQEFTQERASFFTQDPVFGDEFGSMFINALTDVGNYEEMYERHLAPILPRTEANTVNDGTSGLLYAMPFGDIAASGPDPVDGGTLQEISGRGFLRCGITRRALFAQLDTVSQEWSGLDVDFCKALSAAIFDGVTSSVVYSVLPATDRFVALATGQVDVLSRITTVTLSRDVNEPSSGVGFSFSQPDFYDGLSFGGIPPFGICADTLDTTSADCQALLICYNEGTTFAEILADLFPTRFLVPRQSGDLVAEGLATGACNAVAGGVVDVSVSNIRSIGQYEGEYETGSGRFSKDPLALVTRQDDPQWSAYVYWIVSAIFYAEEQGISADSSLDMPVVNLFGALHSRMFRDAVQAVGSYADIYQRNIGDDEAPRGGLNLLNMNPLGPQHYPLPGL